MKKQDIKVGSVYVAKVGDKLTRVRVDSINVIEGSKSQFIPTSPSGLGGYTRKGWPTRTHYACTNLATGRAVTIKSAAKFRKEVTPEPTKDSLHPQGL